MKKLIQKRIFTVPFLTFTLMLIGSGMMAQCYSGWGYKQDVWLKNTSGSAWIDQQVPVKLMQSTLYSAGKMNNYGTDLRITDISCSDLFFYFDSLSTDSVWVKIPALNSGDSMLVSFYYGNPAAGTTSSNGDSTFIFFDDFNDGVIDTAKWRTNGTFVTFSESNGLLSYASTNRWKQAETVMDFDSLMKTFDLKVRLQSSSIYGFCNSENMLDRYVIRDYSNNMGVVRMFDTTSSNGAYETTGYPGIAVSRNIMADLSFTMSLEDSLLTFNKVVNHTAGEDTVGAEIMPTYEMPTYKFVLTTYASATVDLDEIRVRKPDVSFTTMFAKETSYDSVATTACDSMTSPSGNYTWTSSNVYRDTIPNAVGGDSIITINLTIATVDTSVAKAGVTLTSNQAGASYQWVNCTGFTPLAGDTNQAFTPTVNGNYAVIVNNNGCVDTSACYNITSVGIGDLSRGTISLFPNPTDGNLRLTLPEVYPEFDINITTLQGAVVYSKHFEVLKQVPIDVSELSQGTYLIEVKSKDQLKTLRFIKQ